MKSKVAVVALASGLAIVGTQAWATDGTITFVGQVTDQSCEIVTPGGANFTVNLPTVSTATLSDAGAVAGRTPFSINLENCDPGEVATYFEPGPTVDFNTGRLENQADDGAENVQIQLLGSNNNPILVLAAGSDGVQENSQWVEVQDGAADLNYYAEYYATSAATAGPVNTSVQYTLTYR